MLEWLVDSDPAIRWQVMRDLTDEPASAIAKERARVVDEGWGARLLALQADDGNWGGGVYSPKWISTTYTLLLLRHLGANPDEARVRAAIAPVRERVTMGGKNRPFFDYATELCITGMALALGSYFLDDARSMPQPEVLLDRQKEDGAGTVRSARTDPLFTPRSRCLKGCSSTSGPWAATRHWPRPVAELTSICSSDVSCTRCAPVSWSTPVGC
jgi:hypothetical protein